MNGKNEKHNQSLDELTVKKALSMDIEQAILRSQIIIDPAPVPMIPLTPIIVGKKFVKGTKRIAKSICSKFHG